MPFKSQSQRRYMFSQHPEIAKRWVEETPVNTGYIPEKTSKSKSKKNRKDKYKGLTR